MKIIKLLSILFFICSINQTAFCQDQKLKVGLIAGINFNYDYLHSIGLNTGAIGIYKFTENKQFGIEILYTQKGLYNYINTGPTEFAGSTWATHVEIPIHFDWLFYLFRYGEFYDLSLNAGVAYVRNVGLIFSEKETLKEGQLEGISYNERDNYLIQPGLTYNFTERLGVNFKASHSFEASCIILHICDKACLHFQLIQDIQLINNS